MKWCPPREKWVKLNFDGVASGVVAKGNGMVRDNSGKIPLEFSSNLGKASNNIEEDMAPLWGLKLVIGVGWENVVIE